MESKRSIEFWIIIILVLIITGLVFRTAFANLNDCLIAYYPFNENANNISWNGNHGTIYRATIPDLHKSTDNYLAIWDPETTTCYSKVFVVVDEIASENRSETIKVIVKGKDTPSDGRDKENGGKSFINVLDQRSMILSTLRLLWAGSNQKLNQWNIFRLIYDYAIGFVFGSDAWGAELSDAPFTFSSQSLGPDNSWASRWHDFSPSGSVTSYNYLNMELSGTGNIMVQLVDTRTSDEESNGLWTDFIDLMELQASFISIPLIKFSKGGCDLENIRRAVIHYGKKAWSYELNQDSAAVVVAGHAWFSVNAEGEIIGEYEPQHDSDLKLVKGKPLTVDVVCDIDQAVFVLYDQQGDPQPTFFLGGAVQYPHPPHHISEYHTNFMPVIELASDLAEDLQHNNQNSISIYLPPNNLTTDDTTKAGAFIKDLYYKYKISTYIIHFAGMHANPDGEFLLYHPTPENLDKIKKLISEFGEWVNSLGQAVAGVQLGNENDYYVPGAGTEYFEPKGDWDTVNLSAQEYYEFMDTLAGIYKEKDTMHPVFLGHGSLETWQIDLIKDNLTNFDGIAINVYPNWRDGRPATRVMPVAELTSYFNGQVIIAKQLGKPLVISEYGESSYGDLGLEGQKQFAQNVTQALSEFMLGGDSNKIHYIVGLFWHEYFPEYWKDSETHISESDLSLFTPADEEYTAKPAFTGLSEGYTRIDGNLRGYFHLPDKILPPRNISVQSSYQGSVSVITVTWDEYSPDVTYTVQIASNEEFTEGLEEYDTAVCTYDILGKSAGTYWVRVKSVEKGIDESGLSCAVRVVLEDYIEMNLPSGWSMISIPVIPRNTSVSSVFPEAKVVYGYEEEGYVRVEELKVGDGYWILLDQNQTYTLIGQPIQSYSKMVNKTTDKDYIWNMIGGCTYMARPTGDSCNTDIIYKYVQEAGYIRVTESELLKPGTGCWIQLEGIADQCELTVCASLDDYDLTGTWELYFSEDGIDEEYFQTLIFKHNNNIINAFRQLGKIPWLESININANSVEINDDENHFIGTINCARDEILGDWTIPEDESWSKKAKFLKVSNSTTLTSSGSLIIQGQICNDTNNTIALYSPLTCAEIDPDTEDNEIDIETVYGDGYIRLTIGNPDLISSNTTYDIQQDNIPMTLKADIIQEYCSSDDDEIILSSGNITIDTYDGVQLKGSFNGVLEDGYGSNIKGSFDLDLFTYGNK